MANGTQFFDNDKQKYVADTPKLLETFKWLSQMSKEKLIPKEFISAKKDDILKAFVNGETLMLNAGIWDEAKWRTRGFHKELGNVTEQWVADNIEVILFPVSAKGMTPSTGSNPWVYVVPKAAKNVDMIKQLLEHVSAPKLQAEHAVQSSHIPFTSEGQVEVKANSWLNKVGYLINYSKFMPNHPDEPKFENILIDATKNVENASMTPEQAVDWMQKQMKLDIGDIIVR
jgi:inositol-phosphate transport system substrate-binding protein